MDLKQEKEEIITDYNKSDNNVITVYSKEEEKYKLMRLSLAVLIVISLSGLHYINLNKKLNNDPEKIERDDTNKILNQTSQGFEDFHTIEEMERPKIINKKRK